MRIFHVSECSTIELFEPRLLPNDATVSVAVVWAIAESHLVNYLLPRECPRVAFYAGPETDAADRNHFLKGASHVVAIEKVWQERAAQTALWLYELPTESFVCCDATAGYFTATTSIAPIASEQIKRPLTELAIRGAELRVCENLQSLAASVAGSSLKFSCIRMRNAQASV